MTIKHIIQNNKIHQPYLNHVGLVSHAPNLWHISHLLLDQRGLKCHQHEQRENTVVPVLIQAPQPHTKHLIYGRRCVTTHECENIYIYFLNIKPVKYFHTYLENKKGSCGPFFEELQKIWNNHFSTIGAITLLCSFELSLLLVATPGLKVSQWVTYGKCYWKETFLFFVVKGVADLLKLERQSSFPVFILLDKIRNCILKHSQKAERYLILLTIFTSCLIIANYMYSQVGEYFRKRSNKVVAFSVGKLKMVYLQ